MSKDTHSFSVSVACEVGVQGAIIIQHLCALQKASISGEENWQEKWIRRSAKSFAVTYPYWSGKQISGILDSLEKSEYIASKIENPNKYDRTKSYILTRKGLFLMGEKVFQKGDIAFSKTENGKAEMENVDFPKGEMSIKVDYNSFCSFFVEEDASLFSSSSSPENISLKEKKEYTPPVPPPPPLEPPFTRFTDIEPAQQQVVPPGVMVIEPSPSPHYASPTRADTYGIDIRQEIERMKGDPSALEAFFLGRKLPKDRFAEYLDAFALDVIGRAEKYANAAKLRTHCLAWCEIHHAKVQDKTSKAISGAIYTPNPYKRKAQ